MNILVVGGDRMQRFRICTTLSQTYRYVRCRTATNYSQAVQEIHRRKFQMFLLDVGIDVRNSEENGIALGALIRAMVGYADVPIIYLNGDRAHAVPAIHHAKCCDYLLKPCAEQDVLRAVDKYLSRYARKKKPMEFRLPDGKHRRVNTVDIEFIEAYNGQLHVHTKKETIVACGLQMWFMLDRLPNGFVRIHRSYIVNMRYFKNYDAAENLVLVGDQAVSLPVSRTYKNAVRRALDLNWQLGNDELT